jgi:pyruvate/2-oxoglutarate dehydrogenase complex dihydrolipoamide dehydrogenase (E3) component
MNNMKKLGVEIRLQSPHKSVIIEADGSKNLHLDVKHKDNKINCDMILLALGRPPCVESLCLQNTMVKQINGVI